MLEDHPHSIAVFCQPPNDKDATASRRRAVHGDACQNEQGARRTIPSTYLTLTTPSCSRKRGRRRFALVHENPSTCQVAYATEMMCLHTSFHPAGLGKSMGHETHTKNHEKTTWLGTSTHEAELNMVRCRVRRDLRAVFAGVALGDRVAHHVEFSCDFVKVSCRAARQKPVG